MSYDRGTLADEPTSASLGVASRAAAIAYAYEHDLVATSAYKYPRVRCPRMVDSVEASITRDTYRGTVIAFLDRRDRRRPEGAPLSQAPSTLALGAGRAGGAKWHGNRGDASRGRADRTVSSG
jgi:hypothetical protein